MKIIRYEFNDGTVSNVEVTDEFYLAYTAIEKKEKNINRAETRRHISVERVMENGFDFPTPEFDCPEEPLLAIENEKLRQCLKVLPQRQQELIIRLFYDGWKIKDIAAEEGVRPNVISLRLKRILEKIKKVFD